MLRLISVIDTQRRELDRIRASAAQESVVAMARGALMERLGLSSAEAAAQLADLPAATAIPLAEMAAAVLAEPIGGTPPGNRPVTQPGPAARSAPLPAEAAVDLAVDGPELAGTLSPQILYPPGPPPAVVWPPQTDRALVLPPVQVPSPRQIAR